MGATNIEERALLDARLGSGTPSKWYLGLSTTEPNDDGTGITEPTGNGYERLELDNDSSNFPSAQTVNGKGTIVAGPFEMAQATGDWASGVDLTHAVLFDAASNGNARYVGELVTAKPVKAGDKPKVTLTITLG